MNRGSGKSAGGGRSVTPDEADLWSQVASSVDRAGNKPRVPSHTDEAPSPVPPRRPAPEPAKSRPRPPAGPPPPAPKTRPPPIAEFDRRVARQIASAKIAIDARLDLHGKRRRDARSELQAFLLTSQKRGCRTVLIITGKGDAAADRDHLADALGEAHRGVLRRSVPRWLEEPELRHVVMSFTAAGIRHGGNGALYVQLRKPRPG